MARSLPANPWEGQAASDDRSGPIEIVSELGTTRKAPPIVLHPVVPPISPSPKPIEAAGRTSISAPSIEVRFHSVWSRVWSMGSTPPQALRSRPDPTRRRKRDTLNDRQAATWQRLNFLPLPQGQGSLRPILSEVAGFFVPVLPAGAACTRCG